VPPLEELLALVDVDVDVDELEVVLALADDELVVVDDEVLAEVVLDAPSPPKPELVEAGPEELLVDAGRRAALSASNRPLGLRARCPSTRPSRRRRTRAGRSGERTSARAKTARRS
jgi:hypothetical protein